MTGVTEPILLLAISTIFFSPTVYSTLYPQDKITYDITWNTTEITGGPAKGRITERIDNFNNRTDYDNRSILFKRYNGYSYNENNPLTGLVGISGLTGTTGVLYGNTGTTFNSNFSTGTIVSVRNLIPSFLFQSPVKGFYLIIFKFRCPNFKLQCLLILFSCNSLFVLLFRQTNVSFSFFILFYFHLILSKIYLFYTCLV